MSDKKVHFKIDGRDVEADPTETILPVALRHGVEIPHYCFHPGLSIVAQCRLCLVAVEGMPKLQAACSTPIREGMNVMAHSSDPAKQARNEMLELLLTNHPLDCPVCDKGGECELQEFTMRHGPAKSRYDEPKRVQGDLDLGREILNRNRCVVCTRCIRVCKEVAGEDELTLSHRGSHTYVSPYPDRVVENLLSGNMADVCPVGAITTKDFRFRSRVWDLHPVDSVCGLCSRGCNTTVWQKEDTLFRITPRFNAKINSYWMCDVGRFEYRFQSDPKRLRELKSNGTAGTWDAYVRKAAGLLSQAVKDKRSIGVVVTTSLSQEEGLLVKELIDRFLPGARLALVSPKGEEIRYKAFWISGDRGPNRHGLESLFGKKVGEGLAEARSAQVLYVIQAGPEDPFELAGLPGGDLERAEAVIAQDILDRPAHKSASVVLPQATFFESSGTWVNGDGITQTFQKVVDPHGAARPGWWILSQLLRGLGFEKNFQKLDDVRTLSPDLSSQGVQPVGRQPWESRYTYDHWGIRGE
ncbi:MAG: (2Fe-2S)-binding protein [Nitrospirae bacterium]|nr:(2Fe-2S)-binding protein [Nitrospirota bacterium]